MSSAVGLSSNCLVSGKPLDGIGIYTKKLHQHLSKVSDIDLQLWAYPCQKAKVPSHFWPHSFVASTLRSSLGYRYPTQLQLFHSTDYHIPRLKCPVLATLYDAVPLQYPQWVSAKGRFIKNAVMRKTAQWLDGVIAISHAVVDDVVHYFKIPDKKIHVIPLGIDDDWLKPCTENFLTEIKHRYQLPDQYFLFVGTLQPRKNILRLIKAFQLLPSELRKQKKLVIVGQLGWRMDEALPLIQKGIEQQEIIWLKAVHDELALRAIYQLAHIFVFPSLYEGFGIPLLEAFASNVPVITSNVSALPEVAGDAACLVNPHDIEALSHAMILLSENSTLRQRFQTLGYERAKMRTWQACARETLMVYREYL